jgi:hypothetical protein
MARRSRKDGPGNRHSNAPGFGNGNGSGPKQFGPSPPRRSTAMKPAKPKGRSY